MNSVLEPLKSIWTSTPTWAKLLLFTSIPSAIFLSGWFANTYRKWSLLDPRSHPPNSFRFALDRLLWYFVVSRNLRGLNPYDQPDTSVRGWNLLPEQERTMARRSFLTEALPARRGAKGRTLPYVLPQRERFAREWQVPALKKTYLLAFENLAAENETVEIRNSSNQRHSHALYLGKQRSPPTLASMSEREIAHVHLSDLSAHVMLSLADAKEVVAKGWGLRHGLSGTWLPLGWTMLFVPRTVDEVEVVVGIMEAGIRYMYMRSDGGLEGEAGVVKKD
ncbi:hypothetical protein LTR62_004503 [Meristemomyces frigidus]|uniref:Luciferase domain-containing protein n=1 Tax=Meristemomyces frigidus TaxID=1508187 RepID=A0AAN7YRD6_9PEZI|nr:hypothetical protein LTR62_004503 [Meristemomyces frigidus]